MAARADRMRRTSLLERILGRRSEAAAPPLASRGRAGRLPTGVRQVFLVILQPDRVAAVRSVLDEVLDQPA